MRMAVLWWLAGVPLWCALLACIWGSGGSGMIPGRGVVALLVAGCVLAAFAGLRVALSWRSPVTWLAAALVWQGLALACWSVVPEPGLLWWGERAGALLTAIGIAAWCQGQEPLLLVRAVVAAGSGVLVLAVITQLPMFAGGLTGPDLPFGNPNFNVGGALPLLGLALPFLRDRVVAITASSGLVAALTLGTGLRWDGTHLLFGDATRSVWVGLAAMLGLAVILRLPARSHAWIIGGGEIVVLALLAALVAGLIPLPPSSPSTGYRLALWQCAIEAIGHAPLCGGGPASALVSLQAQASSPIAWLWVPSYAEHPHNEYLGALLDGGLIGALLLGAGLLATLKPVWQRRSEPACAALLIAWSGVLTHALIESHLCQPGPLLLLALLTGVSWAVTQHHVPHTGRTRAIQPLLAGLVAVLLAVQIGRDFTVGGSPPMIERRATLRMAALGDQWLERAAVAAQLRARLGDLDAWLSIEAEARARGHDLATAETLALAQVARQPLDATAVDLLVRVRDRQRTHGQQADAERLDAVLQATQSRAGLLLAQVPDNALSHQLRERLAATLKRIAPPQ